MAPEIVDTNSTTFYLLRRKKCGWYQDGTGGLFLDAGDTNAKPPTKDLLAWEYNPEINEYVTVTQSVTVTAGG